MNKTIVVTGLGRCGSSIMMQMLHAGGAPIFCDIDCEWLSGEHSAFGNQSGVDAYWNQSKGKCVKVLDTHRLNIPHDADREYIFIWMKRNYAEQAKSIGKFSMELLGLKWGRNEIRECERQLLTDERKAKSKLIGPVHQFHFEDIIRNPLSQALRLAEILDDVIVLDAANMRSVVIQRQTTCYPGLLEKELIRRRYQKLKTTYDQQQSE